jgi:O-antigen/teichoic acid export membrane protein
MREPGGRHRAGQGRRRAPRHRSAPSLLDRSTLTGRASRALGWSFGSILLNKISLFGIGIMLARILGPHAFGTYAVAYVALTAMLNFNELGVSLAIVRWPGDPAEVMGTVTTISLVVSAVIYACCYVSAPAYAAAMGAPGATGVIRILAIAVLSDAFTNTPAALLQRTFRQGRRVIADQVNVWLGTGVTIALAWDGLGPMSLAIGRVVGCAAGAILLLAFAPEALRLGFDPSRARALLRFGLPLAGANLVSFAVASTDQLVVGHVLGTVDLGFYVLALNVASWPITLFSQPVRSVGPAVFARLQHDRSTMRATFLSAMALLCTIAVPVCALIAGSARPLIILIYGGRWLPSAGPLIWLALLAAVQVFLVLAYDFFVVLARSRFLLTTQLLWLAVLVPALVAGCRVGGIAGASLAELAVAVVCILPCYVTGLRREGIRAAGLGGQLWRPIACAAVTGLVAAEMARLVPSNLMTLAVSSIVAIFLAGSLAYRMRHVLTALKAGPGPATPGVGDPAADAPALNPVAQVASLPMPPADAAGWISPARVGSERLPVGHDVPGYPLPWDLDMTSPLYRLTVTALGWDPAEVAHRPAEPVGAGNELGQVVRQLPAKIRPGSQGKEAS